MLPGRGFFFLIMGLAVAASPSAAGAQGAPTKIAIEHYAFDPPTISVKAGDRIEFTNNDQIPHSVVLEAPNGETFRSREQLDEGETFAVVLSTPGDAVYFCDLHSGMRGKITVAK
ncbi:cupredoxin domain-containing protein [Methylocystis sp. MJC1]|jgi:plastocyanin|uniref:cupredoxin domain-containing protein n=1 Tax=Methylocystis sp. MJC1 TaxID=2654282 RepID=UPI0013EB106D|nr:plastocyanin/azurin family copper-binding protein [Methylocystis sp. MJC1]KAF2989136.1 Plastocyanin [Methylocystis sp. MJC1]MBU6528450.1 cupredoxin domain-containing protein [Methylocystis sp. MJC1]UZX11350.1 cupredoxin domain-containing protein [Methylocystis sp. MJC1]